MSVVIKVNRDNTNFKIKQSNVKIHMPSIGLRGIANNSENSVTSVNGRKGNILLNKEDVGLDNVDNTSDASKPISSAAQAALDDKANGYEVVYSVAGGSNVTVDNTDPQNPIVSATVEGVELFDIVIPDDYPTLTDALTALTEPKSIFIRSGTYNEAGGSFSLAGFSVRGAGAKSTKLVLQANLNLSGAGNSFSNIEIDTNSAYKITVPSTSYDFRLTDSAVSNGGVDGFITLGGRAIVSNSEILSASASAVVRFDDNSIIQGNRIVAPHKSGGGIIIGAQTVFNGNHVYRYATNLGAPEILKTVGEKFVISGNQFFGGGGGLLSTDFRGLVTGNSFFQGGGNVVQIIDGVTFSGNLLNTIFAGGGAALLCNGATNGHGVSVTGNNFITTGTLIEGSSPLANTIALDIGAGMNYVTVTGNSFAGFARMISLPSGTDNDILVSDNVFSVYNTFVTNSAGKSNFKVRDNANAPNDPDVRTLVAGTNITIDNTDPENPIVSSSASGSGAVDSVNGQTGEVVLDTDDIDDTALNRYTNDTDITRLANTSGTNTGDQDLSVYDSHLADTNNPHSVTKSQVGLGNVDNTSDASKPISTAVQSALDTKLEDILGLISAGTNVTITGNGTEASPYVISASGGGGGSGDVVGPNSSADNAVARYDGTTGKLIQSSGATLSDNNKFIAASYISDTTGTLTATNVGAQNPIVAKNNQGGTYLVVQDTRSNTGDKAGIVFGTAATSGILSKSAIAHVETGAFGLGDLVFAVDSNGDSNNVNVDLDEKMRVTSAGDLVVVGSIEITNLLKGIIQKSPDGSRWLMGVSNAGATTWTKL